MSEENKTIKLSENVEFNEFELPFQYNENRDVVADGAMTGSTGVAVPTGSQQRKIAIGKLIADALNKYFEIDTRAENPRIAELEADLEYLNRWKTLIESAPEFKVQKIAVERFLKTDGMRPFLAHFKTRIKELESENFAQSDLIEKLQSENVELRAENERHKNREANEKKATDIIERASKYFGENPDFAVEFSNVKKENERLSAEAERMKETESAQLNAIADWYYLHPNPQADEDLIKKYEDFLTFGQGGANFAESQKIEVKDEKSKS